MAEPRETWCEQVGAADHLVEAGEAELGEDFAHFLGDERHQVDDLVRRAGELGAQAFVLRADADGAGVGMALAHHDAAHGEQAGRADAVLFRAQHRRHDDVAAGAQAAIGAQRDLVAQVVERQHVVRFGKADLPRQAGELDRGLRAMRPCRRHGRRSG